MTMRSLSLATPFSDRRSAGRLLGEALLPLAGDAPVVLGLPRGGVPVAYEVAKRLRAPLDLVMVRKIGAPGFRELAIGAVVDGEHPQIEINQALVEQLQPPPGWIDSEAREQFDEIERRRRRWRGDHAPVALQGRCTILVDDGVATGSSARAALKAIARQRPSKLLFAVPVAAAETVVALDPEVDEIVCLATPANFRSVGEHYLDFTQTTDEQVAELLELAAAQQGER